MRFRTGLVIGLAAGYVLGAKAGTERYDQIAKVAGTVAAAPPVRQLIDETRSLLNSGSDSIRSAVSDGLHSASAGVRDLTG